MSLALRALESVMCEIEQQSHRIFSPDSGNTANVNCQCKDIASAATWLLFIMYCNLGWKHISGTMPERAEKINILPDHGSILDPLDGPLLSAAVPRHPCSMNLRLSPAQRPLEVSCSKLAAKHSDILPGNYNTVNLMQCSPSCSLYT